ncbi:MAG: hypothetical protein HYR94_01060 [Chloroflexi bacterium]|nr:hypothetical protein [Chloroflexota bacterium]
MAFGGAGGVAGVVANVVAGVVVGIVAGGMVVGGAGIVAGMTELLIEERLDRSGLEWVIIDSLLLSAAGGMAFVVTGGESLVMVFVVAGGILFGAGGGLAMRAGNGLSAILAAAGLAGLFVVIDTQSNLSILTIALVSGGSLFAGLYGYVRLPFFYRKLPGSDGFIARLAVGLPRRSNGCGAARFIGMS